MILIISETKDITTDRTIDWLCNFGYTDIVRINDGEPIFIELLKISNNSSEANFRLRYKDCFFNLSDVNFFWYRRGKFNFKVDVPFNAKTIGFEHKMEKFYEYEWLALKRYIIHKLEARPHLGDFYRTDTNKLINLELALNCGLKIPETFISQNSQNLCNELLTRKDQITKPVRESIWFKGEKYSTNTLTKTVSIEELKGENNFISPQLLQENIKKWCELRIFIVRNKVFTMAMFTQNNIKNKLDYRNYNNDKNTRWIPFELPTEIRRKVLNFMKRSKLSTGSIDMILTPKQEYVFLEVNPVGIIDFVSTSCNFNVEKKIAETIIEEINEKG